jgi:hypothetical protein
VQKDIIPFVSLGKMITYAFMPSASFQHPYIIIRYAFTEDNHMLYFIPITQVLLDLRLTEVALKASSLGVFRHLAR